MKHREKRSIVWEYFDEFKEGKAVICRVCKRESKFFGNTSNLIEHLKRKHPAKLQAPGEETQTQATDNAEILHQVEQNTPEQRSPSAPPVLHSCIIKTEDTADMASEQFSLCWDNFHKNMSSGMQSLLESEDLVDVTLAVEGRCLKAHKMVLSVCSPYFRELFQSNPCKHPIVFMKDVSYIALSDLLQFMYQGEVQVAQENLTTFIKTAEALQIKGLTGDSNSQNESDAAEAPEIEKAVVETVKRTHHEVAANKPVLAARVKKPAGPASKRPRFSVPTVESTSSPVTSTPVVTTTTKSEVSSASAAPTSDEIIQFKMEPSETADQSNIEGIDDSQTERYGDESAIDDIQDDTEDYSLMDTGDDEPKAGTSADGMGDGQVRTPITTSNSTKVSMYHTYVPPSLKRGRKKQVVWRKTVFLLSKSTSTCLPARLEAAQLQRFGLGKSIETPLINRNWSMTELQQYMCRLYPNIPLTEIGFQYAKCDRQKKLIILDDITCVPDIENEIRAGVLVLVPNKDISVPETKNASDLKEELISLLNSDLGPLDEEDPLLKAEESPFVLNEDDDNSVSDDEIFFKIEQE